MVDTSVKSIVNKRAHERKRTVYYFNVLDRDTSKVVGHLVDLSVCGMMLVSVDPFEYGNLYHLRLALPFEINGKSDIGFDATKVWSDSDMNEDYLDTGFYFDNISKEDTHRILLLIESYAFKE